MIYEIEHPYTRLSDWKTFRKEHSPYLISEVIDRSEIDLPEWFLPLARGVAIASPYLLSMVGCGAGSRRPRGWRSTDPHVFSRRLDRRTTLVVRRCDNLNLWSAERWRAEPPTAKSDEVLVFRFGLTPIFARKYQGAMYLAEYCTLHDPPGGLHWVVACPFIRMPDHLLATCLRVQELYQCDAS